MYFSEKKAKTKTVFNKQVKQKWFLIFNKNEKITYNLNKRTTNKM